MFIHTYIHEQIGLKGFFKIRTQSSVNRTWGADLGGHVERAEFYQNTLHEIFKN